MITCEKCRQRLFPDDPKVRSGKYMKCGCDYCDKPYYYRELEAQSPPEQVIVHRHSDMSKQDWDLLQQTALKVAYLDKKIAEGQSRRKPRGKY